MKKIGFLLIFALCLVLSGCNKEDEPKYESLDIGYHTGTFKIRVLDKNGDDILKQEDGVKKIKGMLSIEYENVVYTPKIDSDFAFGEVPPWSRLMIGDPDGSESGQCLYFSRFDVISKYDDTFVINWVDKSKDVIHLTQEPFYIKDGYPYTRTKTRKCYRNGVDMNVPGGDDIVITKVIADV